MLHIELLALQPFDNQSRDCSKASTAAATTMLKMMIDPSTPASVRVRAAECVLNHAAKAIEIEDIEARVAELERAAGVSSDGGR